MHNFSAHAHTTLTTGFTASSTDATTAWFDMSGYEAVRFLAVIDSTGTPSLSGYVQVSETSSGASPINVYGSTQAFSTGFAADEALMVWDVYRPSQRYVRLYIDRGTTGESIPAIITERYRAVRASTAMYDSATVNGITIVRGTSS